MNKRTARAILQAQRTLYRAMDTLSGELDKLEKMGASDVSDDVGWTVSHISQAIEEGLGHHIDDAHITLNKGAHE